MPDFPLLLEKHVEIQGMLTLLSGTRIGGSKEELEIGGMDNPVIRNPLTKDPYLPGSSIKGKMRSSLEYKYGKQSQDRENQYSLPCGCGTEGCPVCTIFGPHSQNKNRLGPSRLIVRDAFLTDAARQNLYKLREDGLPMVEVKTENIIDRRSSVAAQRGLRTQERVPPDDRTKTQFQLHLTLRVFRGDDREKLVQWVKEALSRMQKDYLGGSGTRGYGWVKIENLTVDGKPESLPDA